MEFSAHVARMIAPCFFIGWYRPPGVGKSLVVRHRPDAFCTMVPLPKETPLFF
jgi:hypothetical protein